MLSGTVAAGDVYLRAGIGLDRPAETAFTDRNCSSTAPAALYGCGRGDDGTPYRSRGDFGTVPVLDVGRGYLAAPVARLEVLVEYRPRFSFEGHANFLEPSRRQSVAPDLSSLSGMVAGYVDLPGLGLPKIGPFGPFIGVGVGIVRTRIGQTRMTFPRTRTRLTTISYGAPIGATHRHLSVKFFQSTRSPFVPDCRDLASLALHHGGHRVPDVFASVPHWVADGANISVRHRGRLVPEQVA